MISEGFTRRCRPNGSLLPKRTRHHGPNERAVRLGSGRPCDLFFNKGCPFWEQARSYPLHPRWEQHQTEKRPSAAYPAKGRGRTRASGAPAAPAASGQEPWTNSRPARSSDSYCGDWTAFGCRYTKPKMVSAAQGWCPYRRVNALLPEGGLSPLQLAACRIPATGSIHLGYQIRRIGHE